MKVLFVSRKTLFSSPGGDTVQIIKTAEYLRRLGIHVDISTNLKPDLNGYDLVHAFNLMRPQEVWTQVMHARKHNKPVVLSTIYGLYTEYERKGRTLPLRLLARMLPPDTVEWAKVLARAVIGKEWHSGAAVVLRKGFHRTAREVLLASDVLLPNSEGEMRRVERDFNVKATNYFVVPNAVDTEIFNYESVKIPQDVERFRDCVLCVARIEGRKSQLALVRAMKGLPFTLVLIGRAGKHHQRYYKKVRREAPSNVVFVGSVEYERLPPYYKVARVHVLPSWMETPGLASLEAAAMLCNIVITDRGDTREYFGDLAFYCEPGDPASIREAIVQAYKAPPPQALRKRILNHYTWEKAAEATLKGYEKALAKKR